MDNVDELDDDNETAWSELGKKLNEEVLSTLNDKGVEENALHHQPLVKKLMRDIKRIPLWSSICYTKFKLSGRIPASSAPVESENAHLKRGIKKKKV